MSQVHTVQYAVCMLVQCAVHTLVQCANFKVCSVHLQTWTYSSAQGAQCAVCGVHGAQCTVFPTPPAWSQYCLDFGCMIAEATKKLVGVKWKDKVAQPAPHKLFLNTPSPWRLASC